jgi:thiol-disulfide isomerase/thioredoxin
VLLVFTDPRCGTCASLYPDLVAWQRNHDAAFTVTVVSRGTAEANRHGVAAAGVSGVVLQRDNEVAQAYGIAGTPSAVVVAPDGSLAGGVATGAEAIRRLVEGMTRKNSVPVGLGPTQHHGNGQAGGNGNGNGNGQRNGGGVVPTFTEPARLGQPAPEVQLPELDGQSVDLARYRGRELVVVFWNPLCGFCQRLEPQLQQWESYRNDESRQVVIITAGTAEANRELSLRSTVLVDEDNTVGPRFGANGTPMAVLVDAEGRIASEIATGGPAVMALIESPARSGKGSS